MRFQKFLKIFHNGQLSFTLIVLLALILGLSAITAFGLSDKADNRSIEQELQTSINASRGPILGDLLDLEEFRLESPPAMAGIDDTCVLLDNSNGSVAYYWNLPNNYPILEFGERFTPVSGECCTLLTVYIGVDTDQMVGNPDMMVIVYDDDGYGMPGTALGVVTVSYTNYPNGMGFVIVDLSGFNLVFCDGEDFHIGVSFAGIDGEILNILSDDGFNTSNRSWGYYSGAYYSMFDLTGIDYEFLIGVDLCCGTMGSTSPVPGVTIKQVDFLFDNATQLNSTWGLVQIDCAELLAYAGLDACYFNAYSDYGWVIQNVIVDTADGPTTEAYFKINEIPIEMVELSLHSDTPPIPADFFTDGPRESFPVGDFGYDGDGAGEDILINRIPIPPPEVIFEPTKRTYKEVMKNQAGENVQTAFNQCVPMSVANSLQFLENRYPSAINVPHDHEAGIGGDNSLVGQLDSYMERHRCTPLTGTGNCTCPDALPTRTDGCGVGVKSMLDGKFEYLKANGLDDDIVHKHQGYSFANDPTLDPDRLPEGDYYSSDSTQHSKDESKDGKVTWEWIYQQIQNGEDVELIFCYEDDDDNWQGAHAVRVFGAGKTKGVPWLKYKHDALQTDEDGDDSEGLQEVEAKPIKDTDGDGLLNFGSDDQEICFAFSESPKQHEVMTEIVQMDLRGPSPIIVTNSGWGGVDLTYAGDVGILYFNLNINDTWQVQNIPVLSHEGPGVMQTVTYTFSLGVPDGTEVLEVDYGFALTDVPLLVVPPIIGVSAVQDAERIIESGFKDADILPSFPPASPLEGGPAAEPVKHAHENFPNQESGLNECCPVAVSNSLKFLNDKHNMGLDADDIDIEDMKDATNWDPAGSWIDHDDTRPEGQRNAWWEDKKEHMEDNKIPVTTRKITNLADLAAEIDAGQDVELQGDWHTAAIVGITDLGGGKFSIDVAHDTEQGKKGGTKTETIVYNPTTKKFEGSPGFFDGSSFRYAVVECPKEEETGGTNRHSEDGYVPLDGDPVGTIWHELYPTYCVFWEITDWVDNGSGKLDYCDYIEVTAMEGSDVHWEHIEEVTTTITVAPVEVPGEFWYLDFWYGNPFMNPIVPEYGDLWHEVWPTWSILYELQGWEDNGTGYLDSCDWLYFLQVSGDGAGTSYTMHVEGVATDIISVPADPPIQDCDCIPGEANGNGLINILDITYLINYLYKGGPAPTPYTLCSGDANCDCTVNILDITYLIAYLYREGPPPCTCEEWLINCGEPLRK